MEKYPFTPVVQEETVDKQDKRSLLQEAVINTADLFVITTAPDGIITSVNKVALQALGYTESELTGKATPEIFHDPRELNERAKFLKKEYGIEPASAFETIVHGINKRDLSQQSGWTYLHKDGTPLPVSVCYSDLSNGDTHLGYVCIATPVSVEHLKRSKQQLIEDQLQALIASIDDIVFELDQDGRFTQIWVKSDEYLFKPRKEVLGKTLSEVFGSEFAAPFEEGLQNVLQSGEPFQWEYPSVTQHDHRWFCAKCALIHENGKPTNRISVCIQNITDRKNIELSLRESEEKFRLLAESIPGVVFMMDTEKIVYVNNQIENLTGYPVSDFYQKKIHIDDLIHEDDRTYVFNLRDRSREDRISYNLEYRILHKIGIWKWISETGIGVYSGEKTMLEGFLADITYRKESEDELRRMADENSRIFNNSITLSAIAGFDGYFKKLNPAWEKTLGWNRDHLLAKPFLSFIHPDDLAKTEDILNIILSGHTVTMFENRVRCKDGSYRWLLWGSSPDIARKVIYASAIDITSRKKSEEELLLSKRNLEVAAYELEEQNRQLDEFAHIISHNLRAPVSNIKALLNFIDESSQLGDYQLIFEKIKNVTHNISETMNELMETIKIRKTHDIERVEIRFKDILDKVIQSLEGELIESGATVTYNFNNAPKIYYSKPYLESILQNLISNAIKYRSSNRIPEIFVSTDLVMSGIELRVQDNGLGIDLDQYGKKLFGLHKTFHENKEARGVGLFLTKTQIETLGGNIRAESTVDGGTTFIIQF